MITISQALEQSVEALSDISNTSNLDAQILIANKLGKTRTWVLSHPEDLLSKSDFTSLQGDLTSLQNGIPLPYVLGHWEFYGLDFIVTPDILIPRPETETLIELAQDWLREHPEPHLAVDIGTGSGCIAIALANHNPNLTIIATDISLPALKVASENSHKHNTEDKVHFVQGDLLLHLSTQFDLICANLPYIPQQTLVTLEVYGREPDLALSGGTDGLELIEPLLQAAPSHLTPGGLLLIEIESSQGDQVQTLARQYFPFANITIAPDLSGYDRVVRIQQSKIHQNY